MNILEAFILSGALYFSLALTSQSLDALTAKKHKNLTLLSIITATLWGTFYYLTL